MKVMADLRAFLLAIALAAFFPLSEMDASSPTAKYYEFHDNFWMNLHHTLFREMVAGQMDEQTKTKIGLVPVSDAGLSPEEKQAWTSAIHHYADAFAGHRLLFDDQLVTINNLLGQEKDPQKLNPDGLPDDFVKCLETAAPVYRNHWWPDHQKANEQFIAEMQPRVEEFAPLVIPQIERFLGMKWASQPLQVDVTYYVAEVGSAYTTEDPGHTTIASSRDDNHGLPGLETLFHEGAHTLTDKMASAVWGECKRQKKECGDLWHAVQFYTVGVIVKEALAERGTPGYVPYAYRFGLYERGDWPKFRPALERDWQPYLDGKSSFDEAISNLVRDVAVADGRPPASP
jgi:hypothetical protein